MAGHSHWAGIKHKKGRQDKLRSKIFSKISREITVAAKLGSKDPDSNHRLRAAIDAAKQANMPKDTKIAGVKLATVVPKPVKKLCTKKPNENCFFGNLSEMKAL